MLIENSLVRMNKIKLIEAVSYSKRKVKYTDLSIETYITTDNLLQDKAGIKPAINLPPKGDSFSGYNVDNILISNIRPYLKKIWFSKRSGSCSADVLVLSTHKGFNPKFVYYSIFRDDFFEHVMKGAKGTKMPRGDKGQILEFEIPHFSLLTQDRVASLLSTIDSKIDLNNRVNDNLEQMAKTLYDYWFVQFDFPDKDGKPYKSNGGKMVWNEELKREIPEGWRVKSLLDIAEFTNGLACQKFRPIDKNEFLPVIKIKEMNDGLSANTEFVRSDIAEKVIVNNGDVLFSWSASLDVKIWTGGKGGLNQHIFKVTSSNYPRTFFYFETLSYLQHFKMMAELRKTTMGHITQDHLKESRITIPPTYLVDAIHKKINPLIELNISHKKQNQHLSQLRDWLLPMLMNGQVTVE